MPTEADTDLVTAAQRGDQEALAALLAEYLPLVYNVVGRALNGHADIDDVVQETMLRAVRGLGGLREPDRFRSWLLAIAIRQIHERGRSVRTVQARERPLDGVPERADESADFVDSTISRLGLTGERAAVVEASRWLSVADRQLLALWWQEVSGGLTRAEVAEALSLTPQHTAVRIQRMKAQFALARTVLRVWRRSPRCTELSAVAGAWDGRADPRWLKRLGRHVRACPVCALAGRELAPAEQLIAGIAAVPLPLILLRRTGLLATGAGPVGHAIAAPAVGLAHKLFGYVTAKPALAVGTVLAGGAAVFAYAVYYPPAAPGGQSLGGTRPPAVSPSYPRPPAATDVARPSAAPAPPGGGVTAADIFVAPTGSDSGPGSIDRPFATLAKAVAVARPGQTIALRGGVYKPTAPVVVTTSGTAKQRIVVSNYSDERPVIDASRIPSDKWYVTQRASYWTVQGLEIRNAPSHPYVCVACQHDTFRRLSIHDSGGSALVLRDPGTVANQVLDSDFYGNHDDATNGENADGLDFEFGSGTGNLVRGCRVWDNADDGLDLSDFTSPVTIDRTWSWGNGVNRWGITAFTGDGNGFKLGGGDPAAAVAHVVTNSAAWDNASYGFTENGNPGKLRLTNNTAYRNGADGFAFVTSSSVLRQNLALGNNRDSRLGPSVDAGGNSWDEAGWSVTSLRSGDPATAEGTRTPEGGLPVSTFLLNRIDPHMGAPMV